jgi:hypothetical protein
MKRVAIPAAMLLLAACGEAQDQASDVHDLRILAIVADPPEVLFDRDTGTFDRETVTFAALVADPSGEVKTAHWAFCPVESEQTCDDYTSFRDKAAPQVQPILDQMRGQTLEAPGQAAPDQGLGAWSVAPFPTRVDPGVIGYHMTNSALGLGNGAWMSASLRLDGATQSLVGQKRMVVGARDMAQWNAELSAGFGFRVCEAGQVPAAEAHATDCLPLAPRSPNRNPQIAGVMVAEAAGETFAPPEEASSPIVVSPGARLQIVPEVDEGGRETYAFVDTNFDSNRLEVTDREEAPIVSWFATGGELDHERTSVVDTRTLANVFTAPGTAPPGGIISVWMVVRDQRGGTGWRHVEVRVAP